MIKCSNPDCQAINPAGTEKCASCQTHVTHRYLWAAGSGKFAPDCLDERYVWQHQQLVLDTEPGLPPASPDPVPTHIWPYLMLASHGLHVPQPYDLLNIGTGHETLLLDTAAIVSETDNRQPKLLPTLKEMWSTASPLRQLNWLWQIARLWADFTEQQVASSLLSNHLLRVHGSLVRLLELTIDAQPPTLRQLGAFWQTLVPQAQPSIHSFLERLCHQLNQGDIATAEGLVNCLDQAIMAIAVGYQADYGLAVMTDQGPSRKRNEDACYPTSGTSQTHALGPQAKPREQRPLLLLVCDGIGGHEGGDIASHLAIAAIEQQLTPLLEHLSHQPQHDPINITQAIEQAICVANDSLSQHNDQGQRQARDRMGTTLVMALVIGIQIYIAHVGDSRAYRISTDSCRQITFDDDVAAREVRLGYGFYADVVNRPGTGALIQALGMGPSAALHITVQRLLLDDDVVLLLCSDGLSDYDLIEQNWQTHLLPLFKAQSRPAAAVTSLVQLANTYNGHDNVTVGLISGHLQAFKPPTVPPASPQQIVVSPPAPKAQTTAQPTIVSKDKKPPSISSPPKRNSPWPILLGLIGILGTVTALTMVFFSEEPVASPPAAAPSPPETIRDKIDQNTEVVGITDDPLATPRLTPNSYLQLNQPISLLKAPQATGEDSNELGQLPTGTTIQVLTLQEPADEQFRWVRLQVCALPPNEQSSGQISTSAKPEIPTAPAPAISDSTVTTSESPPLNPEVVGWVLETQLIDVAPAVEALNCPPEK